METQIFFEDFIAFEPGQNPHLVCWLFDYDVQYISGEPFLDPDI